MDFREYTKRFHIRLNEQQARAVQTTEGAVLLLAVPGSGKTTTLVARLGYMLYCRDIAPENILTMTYTVPASRDMRARFASFFGEEYAKRLEFRTINSVCVSILASYAREANTVVPKLIEDDRRLLTEVFRSVFEDYPTESELKEAQKQISYAKNMRLTAEGLSALRIGERSAAAFLQRYNEELHRQGKMDFDDQLVYARRILLKCPPLLERFRRRYRYLCVDEAQDTSRIQHEIIRLLAGEGGNLFMVGDEDQSIYGFRAAYPEALLRFEQDYPGAQVMLLEKNYRSTPEIVESADRFIARNEQRREKHMLAVRSAAAPVRRIELADRSAQYAYIARLAEDRGRETAILYRNNDSAIPLIDYLDRAGIPFRSRGGETLFYASRTVREVTDILTLALEPRNEEAFSRIYFRFNLPIGKKTAAEAIARCRAGREKSLIAALANAEDERDWLHEQLSELAAHFAALPSDSGREAIERIRYRMGYGAQLLRTGGDSERLFLLSVLAAREPDVPSVLARLNELKELGEAGREGESGLILSTIHSSKGLEYDRVVIMDAIDGILPSVSLTAGEKPDAEEKKTLEEERRLFYVAATRAKNELLLLSYARQPQSRFLAEYFAPPKPKAKRRETLGKEGASEKTKRNAAKKQFPPGTAVRHSSFGRGTVLSYDASQDIAEVRFRKEGKKSLALSFAVEKGLLWRE